MVSIRGVVAWFWPTLLLVLLSMGPDVESVIVVGLIVVQLLVLVYNLGRVRGALSELRSDS